MQSDPQLLLWALKQTLLRGRKGIAVLPGLKSTNAITVANSLHPHPGDSSSPSLNGADYSFLSKDRTREVLANPEEAGLGGSRPRVCPGLARALSQGREGQLPARTRSSDPAGEVKGSPDPTPRSSPILSLKRKIRKTKVGKNQKGTHFSQSPKDFLQYQWIAVLPGLGFSVTGK